MVMRNIQVVLGVLFGVAVFLFLDYALPSRETVRITNTYNKLTDLNWSNRIFYASSRTGTVENAQGSRDIRFIDTVRPNGKPRVYRNEDTGLIWPPYFKYDSSNLHAIAGDMRSTAENPRWVSVTSYGWRNDLLTVFPNAISITPVAGPDVRPLNWPALVILGILGVLLVMFWRFWNRLRDRRIDAAVRRVHRDRVSADAVAAGRVPPRGREGRGRFRSWVQSWRPPRR